MKLFLASTNVTPELQQSFFSLIGKEPKDINFALIENAADPYLEEKKGFVYDARKVFENLGMNIEKIDLREYGAEKNIYDTLKRFDVVWVGGGNIFYLRWIFRKSGFDAAIARLLDEGIVYGGGSAGAIIAGPTLEKFDLIDDVGKAPQFINQSLSLTDLIVIPHWGQEKYQADLQRIKDYYDRTDYKVITLSDGQALSINGDDEKVCP